MADCVEITLWIDRRWKAAIEKQLKDETLREHLETVLDDLCNQLPEREYERISNEIQNEARAEREMQEAARRFAVFHVTENGGSTYFLAEENIETLQAASRLRNYIRRSPENHPAQFIKMFSRSGKISLEQYDAYVRERMENTGRVTGAFDIDFDKREFSVVHITEGWKSWAMQDVSTAAYHAFRKGYISTEERYRMLLEHLDGREITTAGHLSARNFVFSDEIIEQDGKLNFYIETWFDADKVFGTDVLTDQNNDWLNVYANYDIEQSEVCDTLELTLCKDSGTDEHFTYPLNEAEKEVLLRKMNEFCQQQTGTSLHEYTQQIREEQTQEPELGM